MGWPRAKENWWEQQSASRTWHFFSIFPSGEQPPPKTLPVVMDPTVPQKPTPNSHFYPFIHDISKLGYTVMNQSGFPEAGSMHGHGYPIFLPSQSLSKGKRYLQNPSWE